MIGSLLGFGRPLSSLVYKLSTACKRRCPDVDRLFTNRWPSQTLTCLRGKHKQERGQKIWDRPAGRGAKSGGHAAGRGRPGGYSS